MVGEKEMRRNNSTCDDYFSISGWLLLGREITFLGFDTFSRIKEIVCVLAVGVQHYGGWSMWLGSGKLVLTNKWCWEPHSAVPEPSERTWSKELKTIQDLYTWYQNVCWFHGAKQSSWKGSSGLKGTNEWGRNVPPPWICHGYWV